MTDHLKATVDGLIETLETASELSGFLVSVSDYLNHRAPVHRNKATLHVLVGDSAQEVPIHHEPTNTSIIPTTVVIVCDTKLDSDADAFRSKNGESLLDHEYRVLRALQSRDYWGTEGNNHGWEVSSISRDEPVLLPDGGLDPDIRRTTIELIVDVSFDRTDGPAR